MGRFVSETTVVRADWWDEGEEVEIKRFSHLDRQYISHQATEIVAGEDGSRVVRLDAEALDRAIMQRGIVRWTLKGANGKVAPLTRSAIERLSSEDGEFIVNAIHEFNPRRSAEEQANFRGTAGGGAAVE